MGIIEYFEKLFQPSQHSSAKATEVKKPDDALVKNNANQQTAAPDDERAFEASLQALVQHKHAVNERLIAGNVAIVGLEDIKKALGSRWDETSSRVIELASQEIKRRLSQGDIMRAEEGGLFSICFASPSQKDAEEKASRISKEVKQALLRDMPEFSATLTVRKYVAEISVDDLTGDTATLAERLQAAMARLRLEADSLRLNYRKTLLREFQIFYAPVWDPRAERLVMNRCVIDLTMGFSTLSQFQAIADPDQMADTLADLDCVILARALEALHMVRRSQPGASVIVPVGFQTLSMSRSRYEFGSLLETIPVSYRPNLMLEISAIPATAPVDRVEAVLDTLAGYTDRILLQLNGNPKILNTIETQGLWGVSWNLTGWDGTNTLKKTATRLLVEKATARNLVTVAHSANSIGQAVAAVEIGFDFVDGTAIHLSVDAPRAPAKLHPLTYPRARRP
ncbi:hypothetical protein SAMN04487974_1313 [Pelagibacterium luteolum]|uniref:GGDEF domain-containing protein n=2 Tax=Pelagibacterium luteolum TaxID=440168 RepID=A0A1G8AIA2_9HYPH|nr:hypothetical protein SAMN04487974_1313 [Pelagibacterium luteolum]